MGRSIATYALKSKPLMAVRSLEMLLLSLKRRLLDRYRDQHCVNF